MVGLPAVQTLLQSDVNLEILSLEFKTIIYFLLLHAGKRSNVKIVPRGGEYLRRKGTHNLHGDMLTLWQIL